VQPFLVAGDFTYETKQVFDPAKRLPLMEELKQATAARAVACDSGAKKRKHGECFGSD